MTRNNHAELSDIVVHSLDEIPAFKNEDEEFEYWATHSLGDEILESAGPLPEDVLAQSQSQLVSLYLNNDVVDRLKAVAKRRNGRYQSLLREFIIERLEDEERRLGQADPTHEEAPRHVRQSAAS